MVGCDTVAEQRDAKVLQPLPKHRTTAGAIRFEFQQKRPVMTPMCNMVGMTPDDVSLSSQHEKIYRKANTPYCQKTPPKNAL
jgi:hypothetical protein